eukprot:m.148410 g.148410  ORF g.148410 m.148410 type:complete len:504 (+) comp38497_c1_seq10:326-1837(+)
MICKSFAKNPIVLAFVYRIFLVSSVALIVLPIVAYVVSEEGSSEASNSTSRVTCFPSVPQVAAPLIQNLLRQNVSQEQLLGLLGVIRTRNLSQPAVLQATFSSLGEPLIRALTVALNASNILELLQKAQQVIPLFGSKGQLLCHEDTVADLEQGCCYFSCPKWNWYSTHALNTADALLYIGFCLGIIAMIALVPVLVKIPEERKFPNVIPYYITFIHFIVCKPGCFHAPLLTSSSVLAFVMCVVRWIGREDAICCNEKNHLNAAASEACGGVYVQTLVEQYGGTCLTFWWAFAVFNVWLITVHQPKAQKSTITNKLFFFESVIAWILPAFLVGIQFAVKKSDSMRLQPFCHDCMGLDHQLLYFFYTMEAQIGTVSSGIFIAWLFYHRYRKDDVENDNTINKDDVIFTSFRYLSYISSLFFFISWNILVFCLSSFGSSDIRSALTKYFQCAADAFSSDSCVRGGEAQYSTVLVLLLWPLNVFVLSLLSLFYLFSSPNVRGLFKF